MSFIQKVINNIINNFESSSVYPSLIASVLLMVLILSLYMFFVYHVIIRRSLYNKSFNICITVIPFFVSTIILCLQSSLVITLGTIGALAIIRFRTAVKDPVDMVFILWAIYIGIICGCQLYELAIVTSLLVTIVLLGLNFIGSSRKSHILIMKTGKDVDMKAIEQIIKDNTSNHKIKSRNYTEKGINIVVEIVTKEVDVLCKLLDENKDINMFSLMEYVPDDII